MSNGLQPINQKADPSIVRIAEVYLQRRKLLRQIKGDALWWLRNATRTFDKHWQESGFESPYNSFPEYEYFNELFAFLGSDNAWLAAHELPQAPKGKKHLLIGKSRDMMVSWGVVGYFTHKCMTIAEQEILFQSQKQPKANDLVEYAKTLWDQQDDWLKAEFPLTRRLGDFPMDLLEWENGSRIIAIPEGADQVKSHHPTGLFMDEGAFQPEGEGALGSALPACNEIVIVSSPGAGWLAEFIQ